MWLTLCASAHDFLRVGLTSELKSCLPLPSTTATDSSSSRSGDSPVVSVSKAMTLSRGNPVTISLMSIGAHLPREWRLPPRPYSISLALWNHTTVPWNSTVRPSPSMTTMSSKPSSHESGDSTSVFAPR